MAQLLNTHVLSTAAESPWQNDIRERHNAIISNMVDRILEDVNCSIEVAVAWALSAKNSLKKRMYLVIYQINWFVGRTQIFPQ